jgi:hypothetical protein
MQANFLCTVCIRRISRRDLGALLLLFVPCASKVSRKFVLQVLVAKDKEVEDLCGAVMYM